MNRNINNANLPDANNPENNSVKYKNSCIKIMFGALSTIISTCKLVYNATNWFNRSNGLLDNNKQLSTECVKKDVLFSEEIGHALKDMFNDEDHIIGIHCAGIVNPEEILSEGLELTGHSSSGVITDSINLEHNIHLCYFYTFNDFILLLSTASRYKTTNRKGSAVIVKIPKAEFDNIESLTNPGPIIYNTPTPKNIDNLLAPRTDNFVIPTLKPEYIAGYIKVSEDINTGKVTLNGLVRQKKVNRK